VISVDRSRVVPAVLAEPKRAGLLERAKAIAFYALRKNRTKPFPFKAYSRDEVKQALAQLFHGKCAYCENRYAATQPVDVEHWRPKQRVIDEHGREVLGYYWLAADWSNLLPSCIDCNRERRQEVLPTGEVRLLGKGERFPLRRGSKRARKPDEERLEDPLLLNPCEPSHNVERQLEFTDKGVVRPRRRADRERAQASIEVYGLNRSALVQERLEIITLMQQRMRSIEVLIRFLRRKLEPEARLIIQDLLSHEMAALLRFADRTRPFSAMAQQLIEGFEQKLNSGRI
jgi:uncharacterized protein (TIGR02646 family)